MTGGKIPKKWHVGAHLKTRCNSITFQAAHPFGRSLKDVWHTYWPYLNKNKPHSLITKARSNDIGFKPSVFKTHQYTSIHTQLISPFYSAETCVHYTFCDQVIIKFKLKTELKIDPMANENSKTVVRVIWDSTCVTCRAVVLSADTTGKSP